MPTNTIADQQGTPIFSLTIESRHGPWMRPFTSEAVAKQALVDYCRQNWTLEDVPGEHEPLNQDQVIAAYFERMDGAERFLLNQALLETEAADDENLDAGMTMGM
jgi:hypothetical protein